MEEQAKQAAAELAEKLAVEQAEKARLAELRATLKVVSPFEDLAATGGLRGISNGSDDCNTAGSSAAISGDGAHAFDLTAATNSGENQSDNSCLAFGFAGFNQDVWYCWTATASCNVTVSVCGAPTVPNDPNVDLKMAVYGGCECPVAGGPIVCNEDSCFYLPQVTFAAVSGQQYLIRLGISPAAGTQIAASGMLTVTCQGGGGGPADDCSMAAPVGEGTFTGDTANLTGVDVSACATGDDIDAWYAYTPSINGSATFTTCGSTLDTTLSVFSSCGGASLGCNDAGTACGGDGGAALTLTVSAGTTYYVRVAGASGQTGQYQLTISVVELPPGPANDFCSDATDISGDGQYAWDNNNANTDGPSHPAAVTTGCLNAAQPQINGDVWYCWTATCSGAVSVSTCTQTTLDTKIAIYTTDANCTCPTGDAELLTCQDDASGCGLQTTVTFGAQSGSKYLIRIGSFSTTVRGSGTFSVAPCIVAPANDQCANAAMVGEGAVSGTTVGATGPDVSTCGTADADDVWYLYTPTMTGTGVFSTCGATTIDTTISLFPSCGGSQILCIDDGCGTGTATLATAPVVAGVPMLVRVAADGAADGDFTLTISVVAPPANDDCAAATAVGEGAFPGTLTASTGTDVDTCAGTDNTNDVWYRYTPSMSGVAAFSTCGATTDTVTAVFTGCPDSGGTPLTNACSDAGCATGGGDVLAVAVTTGTQYWVRISGDAGTQGDFTLTISVTPPTNNDLCGTATSIQGTGSFPFSTVGATTDSPAPNASCVPSGGGGGGSSMSNDVWYCWTSNCTGRVTMTLAGTTTDMEMAIFPTTAQCVCPTSSAGIIACDDDLGVGLLPLLSFDAVNGVRYLIEVGHFSSTAARTGGTVEISCVPSTPVGGCCFANGSCEQRTAADCAAQSGTYRGDDTLCANANCPQPPATGGCCLGAAGNCQVLTQAACTAQGGFYLGDNERCDAAGGITPFASGAVNIAIPDNNVAGISSTVNIEADVTMLAVSFDVTMRHTWIGDLICTVTFTPADGSAPITADLFRRPNSTTVGGNAGVVGDSSNLGAGTTAVLYTFTDSAAQTIWTASLAGDSAYNIPGGPYRAVSANNTPVDLNATFGGRSARGTWTIAINDNAGADTGVLASWAINVTEPAGDPPCENIGGACCLDRCTCEFTTEAECQDAGGVFGGNGSTCVGEAGECFPTPACPCDWNGFDGLDSQDYFDFLNSFFDGEADYNCFDGTDSQDFFDFLNCFFANEC